MEKIQLSKIADVVGAVLPEGCDGTVQVEEAAAAPDKVKPGCLYFSILPGTEAAALDKGAAAAVTSRPGAGCIVVEDPLRALNKLAAWYRQRFHTWIIGVTGSIGKTTVKEMVHNVLETEGRTKKSSWDLDGEAALPMALLDLDWSDKNAVLEMGFTRSGGIARMSRIVRPSAGLITCVGTGHLTQCGSREALLREKLSITEGMSPSSPLILNGDDELLQRAYETVSQEIIAYGIGNPAADIRGKILSEDLTGSVLEVSYYGRKQRVKVPLWGRAGVYNALAAYTAGVVAGIDPEKIAGSIAAFKPAPHRQNILRRGDVTILDDSCSASPESVREALNFLSRLPGKRRVAVLGEMPDLGEASENAHRAAGRRAAQCGTDLLCCLGEHAAFTAEEAQRMGGTRALAFEDQMSLITYLQNDRRKGDVVLVKGDRAQKMNQIIDAVWEDRGRDVDSSPQE